MGYKCADCVSMFYELVEKVLSPFNFLTTETLDFFLTGPPKLVVTPTKLTLMDPFQRGLGNSDVGRPPHYTKTRAPAISSQSQPRNGHLSASVTPTWTEATVQPHHKMGVASLLFHRTLSPKDTLLVHNYTLEKQKQPHTQLQVHSYAREHQPRHLQLKASTMSQKQFQPISLAPDFESVEPQPETKIILTEETVSESEAQSPVKTSQEEDKLKMSMSVEAEAEEEKPKPEPISRLASTGAPTQFTQIKTMEAPKNNKRKVIIAIF